MQFDQAKLKELILYACSRCDPSQLGAVKLHKILYFSDMLYFAATGTPITGATYRKRPHGPTCDQLLPALRDLECEGSLSVRTVDYFGYQKKEYLPQRNQNLHRLAPGEINLIDEIIDFVCNEHSAKTISEFSHNRAWETVAMGKTIPYASVFMIFPNQVSEAAMSWAETEAKKIEAAGSKKNTVGFTDFRIFRKRLSETSQ